MTTPAETRPAANTETREVACNLCGDKDQQVLSLRDRDGHYLRTVICRSCGLVFSNPQPTSQQTRKFYAEEYRLLYKQTLVPRKKHIYRAGQVALDRYDLIQDVLQPNMRILDVGSGAGELVYLLCKRGYEAEGIEPNEGYARYSIEQYGLSVQVGFMQDVTYPEHRFDAITMYHVLEHTGDPLDILARLRGWLKPGGILIVEVPNLEAVCQAPAHRFHLAHLHNFNQQTLETLGTKAGFEVQRTRPSADYGNLMTIFRSGQVGEGIDGRIPGNQERIKGILDRHTSWSHYLTSYPYVRFVDRLRRSLRERRVVKDVQTGKQILDALYSRP